MYLMDLKCLFLEDLFLVYIQFMQKHLQQIYPVLLLMEKVKGSNTGKNNKKWDGQYNQQLQLLLIMLEFLFQIELDKKEQDLKLQ